MRAPAWRGRAGHLWSRAFSTGRGGELCARPSAPPVRLGVQPPHTSPSLGTWNLVRSVTGDYVGYRFPERAPDRRTALRAHHGPLRARARMSAPPPLRPRRAACAPDAPSRAPREASPRCLKVRCAVLSPLRRAARGPGLSAGPEAGGGAGRPSLEARGAAGGRGDVGHSGGRPASASGRPGALGRVGAASLATGSGKG